MVHRMASAGLTPPCSSAHPIRPARAIAAALALLAVLAGSAFVLVRLLDGLADRESRVTHRLVRYAEAVDEVAILAGAIANDERGYLLSGRQDFLRQIREQSRDLEQALSETERAAALHGEREQRAMRQLRRGSAAWQRSLARELDLAHTDPAAARALAFGHTRWLRKRNEHLLARIDGRNEVAVAAAQASFLRDYHRARLLGLGALGVELLLAVGLLGWLVGQVRARAALDAEAAEDARRRELDRRHQRDEVVALIEEPGRIRPVFQPLVDLRTGLVVAYEALARFVGVTDPSPGAWFARAHELGLGAALESAAITAALAAPGRPPGTSLSLNARPSLLLQPDFALLLPADLSGLVIEITEHELVRCEGDLAPVLAEFRRRGGRIAVDDAGAGYAGFGQLLRVRPDVIKLDRSLVDGAAGDPAKLALIEAFVRFARRIGAVVCCEGIERLEDLVAVGELDVAYAQGFLLARPGAWPDADQEVLAAYQVAADDADRSRPVELHERATATSERSLAGLSRRMSQVACRTDVDGLTAFIAAELHADEAAFSRYNAARRIVETVSNHDFAATGDAYHVDRFPTTRDVVERQELAQVIADDPRADPSEVDVLRRFGFASLLMAPVVVGGQTVGLLEFYLRDARPWSRTELHRAQIVAFQLGALLQALDADLAPHEAAGEVWQHAA
jgi:EAL domain-containing protein (putative c-di-GMP-specific phosphodiesterase class I)/CHASE3 domain sensor protein